jgi:hypothetical protein
MNSTPPLIDDSDRPDHVELDDNPLWLVAAAMGLLFGLLACLIAAS